ncbi:MAG: WbqC family protein [Flavobacteriales bacterium]|nr:WbqC family protein [Flavobacteriales bacterium]MCW8937710.1 WbqC family protein [Flavobacteriales bacterium]MCW8968573.1 WbqC family protein [Flavobacteriales bacterium]MCW8990198.1 WbqC family protein [Flavobacteriales bacterium]MCW9019916.1 WbqC family protein [Flavobacteriales bacterium]
MTQIEKQNEKKVLITQSNYIPWKGYFDNIDSVDEFVVYDDMQFTKRDWRNRNQIKTPQGLLWLTIPVEVKGKFHQKINETKVADKNWRQKHWKTIVANYSKAPYFKEYKDVFEELYRKENINSLTNINLSFIQTINQILDINTKIIDSREFTLLDDKVERLIDICKKLNATDYYTGPAAKDYMDNKLFLEENINVHYFDYSKYPTYFQLYNDFTHYVSIIDLIFNTGKNAKNYFKNLTHE